MTTPVAALFVYGELCKPAVLMAQLGRVPPARLAILAGWWRRLDPATGYYRASPRPGARLVGLLLEGLEADDLGKLDTFEAVDQDAYRRVEVEVEMPEEEGTRTAWIYADGRDVEVGDAPGGG